MEINMKEQKTLRRKIAEKVVIDANILNRRPSELGFTEQLMRQNALATADAIIKQVKREVGKTFVGPIG
jgi:hypothetical protein